MNLSIVLTDFLEKQGILKTYRFIPTNEWNRVVVDRIDDIDSDVKGNTDQDIGLLRVYNSDKCQLITTSCKIKNFEQQQNSCISFQFEHMYVPVETSRYGGCGEYSFILPFGFRLTDLHIVDPFDKSSPNIEEKKHFRYNIYWDAQKKIQAVQMTLLSSRGSFSFIVKGVAEEYNQESIYLPCVENDILLDRDLSERCFDSGIKKSFWRNLKDSIILEPNFNGIGIDLKSLFKKQ